MSVSARFLTETRDEAVDLLRAAWWRRGSARTAIDRVRAQVISGIQSDTTDPDEIVTDAFATSSSAITPMAAPKTAPSTA